MAALRRLARIDLKFVKSVNVQRNYSQINYFKGNGFEKLCLCVAGGTVLLFAATKWRGITSVYAYSPKKKDDELKRAVKLTSRERRFIRFASVEYHGQLYMTPQDFLESVVEQEPRPRLKRRFLTEKEIEQIKDHTPSLKKGSSEMFRKLRDKGIISYTEYLFLLSILTKPQSGFRIAFNMFDTDGNERVDKNEFLVLVDILTKHSKKEIKKKKYDEDSEHAMEKIFSHAWKDKRGLNDDKAGEESPEKGPIQEQYVDDEQGLQRRHSVDTTLITHFFGKKGKEELRFEGFRRFMENLQSEVLELEFHEFSKGHNTISEVDFARILLRYTYLDTDEYDNFLDRLLDRIKEERGISLDEFKAFCQFLNNLEDFAIAMKMYTLADHPISKEDSFWVKDELSALAGARSEDAEEEPEFGQAQRYLLRRVYFRTRKVQEGISQYRHVLREGSSSASTEADEFHRAVKICTGNSLSRHLVHTVFAIFDEDGDGHLSYREFIAIMKDRLHRGFKSYAKNDGWDAFKFCVKQEMKTPS